MTRTPEEYAAHKRKMAEKSLAMSREGRDIGAIPPVRNQRRRRLGLGSYRGFLEEYFPSRFPLAWGAHHLKLIDRIDSVVKKGGLHAVAMPRGEGKTTTVEPAPLFAALTGHHLYSMLIGNSEPKSVQMLDSLKTELLYNDLLFEDFPEVCYPIRMLEGQANRAGGQLHHGQRTMMRWAPEEIRLPVIPGSPASGATIRVAGITGNIRGAVRSLPSGERIRPTFAAIDDPQTDESAFSPAQCDKRHKILNGGILGLCGPGRTMAAICPCTVIEEDDLSDRLLDRSRSPDWTGERTSMLIEFPKNEDLWDRYDQLRRESLERFDDTRLAIDFYRDNRAAMDEGAVVSWEERYDPDAGELSAVQAAMNLYLRDPRAFASEYQNKPIPKVPPDSMMLTVEEIRSKTNGHKAGLLPFDVETLVAHIDIQQTALFWTVMGFAQGFTGWIIDYGAHPKPPGDYFTLATMKKGFKDLYPDRGYEGQLYAALTDLVADIAGEWEIDAGSTMKPSQILIDAAYGPSTDTVYQFARSDPSAAIILPAFGRGLGAAQVPMGEYAKKRGERVGLNWRVRKSAARSIRHAIYDTNFWKSFVHARLKTPIGEPGALTLYEPGRSPTAHRMIAENLTAEVRVTTEGRGRRVDEWTLPNRSRDNHLFDNVVGCHVAASMQGITMPELQPVRRRRGRGRMTLSEIQKTRVSA